MSNDQTAIHWLPEVEEHNYPAAESFLGLIYPEEKVKEFLAAYRRTSLHRFKAKDVFRASGLSLLGVSNGHVKRDLKKIRKGTGLSPILLVRDPSNGKVIIADGYHRMCAVYRHDEDAWIPCKIV